MRVFTAYGQWKSFLICGHRSVGARGELLWQEQKQAAARLLKRTYNVTQNSTRRSVHVVDETVTQVDSPLTLSLHVLQALRVDESHVDVKLKK
jgi:hypothetical protein